MSSDIEDENISVKKILSFLFNYHSIKVIDMLVYDECRVAAPDTELADIRPFFLPNILYLAGYPAE